MSITKHLSNPDLITAMDEVRKICSAAANIRTKNNIRNRMPLQNLTVLSIDKKFSYLAHAPDLVDIIKDECNVRVVTLIQDGMEIIL